MTEHLPPTSDSIPNPNEPGARAAEAERRASPVPVSGPMPPPMASAPQGPSLGGPYPPVPYQPYPEYPPSPPYQSYPAGEQQALHPPSSWRGGRERARVSPAVVASGSLLMLLAILIAAGLIFAGVLQGMAAAAKPAQATQTQSFTVSGAPTLALDLTAVNVHVVPGLDGRVTATLTTQVQAITHAAAQQALAGVHFDATQDGDTIHVSVSQPSFDGIPAVTRRTVDLTVAVPASSNLDLTLVATNLHATGLSGTLVGQVSASNLTLDGMTVGGDSSLHVSAGNVEYHGALAPGANLDVDETAGNVHFWLPQATSTHVQASVTGGNASVSGWSSVGVSRSGNGSFSVDLNPRPTSTISVQVTGGNVTVEAGA